MTGGALVLVAATALTWFWYLPNHRSDLRPGERYGVDVSRHQNEIDWDRVADDNIDFAYIKASEGGDLVDERFTENWKDAGGAGLDRGAYHYFTLCRPGDEQAANFLATLPGGAELPPALDLEIAGNCSDRPDEATVAAEVAAFIEAIESETGEKVVLYIGDDWQARYPVAGSDERPRWARRIHRRPLTDDWWLWQFSATSRVDGIAGHTDLNVMKGDGPPE
ncbi:MAG: glycosyl hydrolase 25 family protein [Ilumatobacteraceae bacterium]|nr:glycosyl hydrolase 25 family protein [Ilumatobacteraceae bacterium]